MEVSRKDLYMDCSWLDPKKFEEILNIKSISEFLGSTFVKISELTSLSKESLLDELSNLHDSMITCPKMCGNFV